MFLGRDAGGSPITDIQVIKKDDPTPDGYKKNATNLSHEGGGDKVFICYKQDSFLRNIKFADKGASGYKFIDIGLNVAGCLGRGPELYALSSDCGTQPPITDLVYVPKVEVRGRLAMVSTECSSIQ